MPDKKKKKPEPSKQTVKKQPAKKQADELNEEDLENVAGGVRRGGIYDI